MIKGPAILLAIGYGLVMWVFSAWRLKRELDAKSKPLVDPLLSHALARMADALELERIDVHVYEVEPVNGLAAPDGRIFITRGFLQKFRAGEVTSDELASVVAHELGHVALGHARRRLIDFSGQNAIRAAVAGVLGRFIPVAGLAMVVANALATLVAARLSRQDEFEADAYAAALLTRAGIGTAPQKSLFTKLEKMTGMGGKGIPAWLMSHPKPEVRIAAIEALEARWSAGALPPR